MKVVDCRDVAVESTLLPEWAPQQAVMLTWPHRQGDWGDGFAAVEDNFYRLAEALLAIVPVVISVESAAVQAEVQQRLPDATVAIVPSNDIWVRDHGPLGVVTHSDADAASSPALRLLNAGFNGWGNKYPAELDNTVTTRLAATGSLPGALGDQPLQDWPLVVEGGALETDGHGTLMTRLCCLPERNRPLSLDELSHQLAAKLGTQQIVWLEHGELEGDDTDAHIDTLARFLPDNVIAVQGCDRAADSHYEGLQSLTNELRAMRDTDGRPYDIVELPWPDEIRDGEGQRLPAGYANFLICNQHLLVPTYRVPQDELAIATLQQALPDYKVVAIDCLPLVQQYGSLHCATMQIPAKPTAG